MKNIPNQRPKTTMATDTFDEFEQPSSPPKGRTPLHLNETFDLAGRVNMTANISQMGAFLSASNPRDSHKNCSYENTKDVRLNTVREFEGERFPAEICQESPSFDQDYVNVPNSLHC